MGLQILLCKIEKHIEFNSSVCPDHSFKIGRFNVGYGLGSTKLKDELYYIFNNSQENTKYTLTPDWATAKARALNLALKVQNDGWHYLALRIIAETCDYVMSQVDTEAYCLRWEY